MKKLDRYVARDLILPFISATIALAAIFMLYELIGVVKQHFGQVPSGSLLQLAAFAMPKWMVVCLPGGLSLSVGLVVSRLMRESEMTALRSAGVPISRVLRPVVVFSCLMAAFSYGLLELVVPNASREFQRISDGALLAGPGVEVVANQSMMIGPYLAHADSIHKNKDGSQTLDHLFLYNETNQGTYTVYDASLSDYRDGVLTLNQANFARVVNDQLVDSGVQDLQVREELNTTFTKPHIESQSITELLRELQATRASHGDTRLLEATLYQQILAPLTCILFALMSAYSSVRWAKIDAFLGLFASSFWPWIYFNVEVSGLALAKNSIISPIVGTWGVLSVFAVGAVFLVRGVE